MLDHPESRYDENKGDEPRIADDADQPGPHLFQALSLPFGADVPVKEKHHYDGDETQNCGKVVDGLEPEIQAQRIRDGFPGKRSDVDHAVKNRVCPGALSGC